MASITKKTALPWGLCFSPLIPSRDGAGERLTAQNPGVGSQDVTPREIREGKKKKPKALQEMINPKQKAGPPSCNGDVHTETSQHLPFICRGMTESQRAIYKGEAWRSDVLQAWRQWAAQLPITLCPQWVQDPSMGAVRGLGHPPTAQRHPPLAGTPLPDSCRKQLPIISADLPFISVPPLPSMPTALPHFSK